MNVKDDHRLGDSKCVSPNFVPLNVERASSMYIKAEGFSEANSPRSDRTDNEVSGKSGSSSSASHRVAEDSSSFDHKDMGVNVEQDKTHCVRACSDGISCKESVHSEESSCNPDMGCSDGSKT